MLLMSEIPSERLFNLNAGGSHVEVKYSTLAKCRTLRDFIDFANPLPDSEIIINRNPGAFCSIINWLRDPGYEFPSEYLGEIKYYGIEGLPDHVVGQSKITSDKSINESKKLDYCIEMIKEIGNLCKTDLCKYKRYHQDYCISCGKFVEVDRKPIVGDVICHCGSYYKIRKNNEPCGYGTGRVMGIDITELYGLNHRQIQFRDSEIDHIKPCDFVPK